MPKYGIHFLVLDKLIKKLKTDGLAGQAPRNTELFQLLNNNRFAANLGAIGPDLLFWTPDYKIVRSLMGIVETYNAIDEKLDAINKVIDTVEDKIDDTLDEVKNALQGIPIIGSAIGDAIEWYEVFDQIKEDYERVLTGIEGEIKEALFVKLMGLDGSLQGITQARSLFQGLFQSGTQMGREEMEWYWFDMLHYRRTGDFVKNLVKNAESSNDDSQKAYAYGYMTHYATDLVGHPFVNTISGAPYRISVQRHVVIENFMDQWKWFNAYGKNIRNSLYSAFDFQDVPEMPDALAKLISETLKETYKEVLHPLNYSRNSLNSAGDTEVRDPAVIADDFGFLDEKDIKIAYKFQRNILEFLGGKKNHTRPAEPYTGADADLAAWLASAYGFPPPPPLPGLPSSASPEAIDAFFTAWMDAIQHFVEWLFDSASRAMGIASDAVKAITNSQNLSDDAKKVVLLINYWLQLQLYDIYRSIHQVLALAGLGYPEPEDVRLTISDFDSFMESADQKLDCFHLSNTLAKQLIQVGHCNKTGYCGCTAAIDEKEDIKAKVNGFPILRSPGQSHLLCASYLDLNLDSKTEITLDGEKIRFSHFEHPCTTPSFYKNDSTPDIFISETPFDLKLFEEYVLAVTPEETRALYKKFAGKSFGNAIDISAFLLLNATSTNSRMEKLVYCNWNLDGDRGYGYHTWDGIPFTSNEDEINGVLDGNEDIPEFNQMCSKVWYHAQESIPEKEDEDVMTKYLTEVYVDKKTDSILSTMMISEAVIPLDFIKSRASKDQWISLVPDRFRFEGNSISKNFIFVNGLATTPSAGQRAMMSLQKTLNDSYDFSDPKKKNFNLRYFHNYSKLEFGLFNMLFDLVEVVFSDYLYSRIADIHFTNPVSNITLPDIKNPTQVSLIALLHYGMNKKIPLLISGHSQGAMISGNAILAFSFLGQEHKDYLKTHVKVFHLEPELPRSVRQNIRSLVKSYLVYIMNNSDPSGTDILTEFFAGDLPGLPGQPISLLTDTGPIRDFLSRIKHPDPLNFTFYTDLLKTTTDQTNNYLALIDTVSHISMAAHYMPHQLSIIRKDIEHDRFRTDPGTLADPTVQLSTSTGSLNATSVKVKDFFLD